LMTSSYHGHSEMVRELLSRGARVQAVDKQGSTALSYAFGGLCDSQALLYHVIVGFAGTSTLLTLQNIRKV